MSHRRNIQHLRFSIRIYFREQSRACNLQISYYYVEQIVLQILSYLSNYSVGIGEVALKLRLFDSVSIEDANILYKQNIDSPVFQ